MDGPGQKNPDRSEGPWGRAAEAVRTEVFQRATSPAQNGDQTRAAGSTKDEGKLIDVRVASHGKALSDQSGLEAVLGKTRRTEF